MLRRNEPWLVIAGLLLVCCGARAQEDRHARYLSDFGLGDVYAEYLLDQLEGSTGAERTAIAQELAGVYLDLLQEVSAPSDRQRWAERAAALLRVVPEADSPGLRLGLAQAAYFKAEETAERSVLLLTTERESAEAQRILREVGPTFVSIAQQAHQEADRLERELSKQLEREEEDDVAARLAEARRVRSIAFYFAGWCSYYTAELSGNEASANQALRHFGWILGARDGSAATVDQMQPGLLRYEHVARSAIGAAMACSITGRSLEARAWLDAVARSTEAPESIRATLPSRRVRVLAAAGAWPDVDTIARRALASTATPPDTTFTRLIAVLSLERLDAGPGRHTQLVRRLAEEALASLVRAAEIGHVTDLARRFGGDLVEGEGFVPSYVRAVMQHEAAREILDRYGSGDARAATALLEAAQQLTSASSAPDADRFPEERARALFDAGLALYEAGRLTEAGELFEQCQVMANSDEQRREAAWMRVVTLERAVEQGDAASAESRDQAALLFLSAHPNSDEAAQLALRPSTARLLTEGQAVEILLSVPPSASNYAAARRRASALLYRRYRAADPIDRPLVAEQFMALAEELVAQDGAQLRAVSSEQAGTIAEGVIISARRLADVALTLPEPDLDRAIFALETIERTADYASIDLGETADELRFRRLQIASAQGRYDEATRLAEQIAQGGSPFATTAVQLMYRDSVRVWIESQGDPQSAERVVRFGQAVRASLADRPAAIASVLQTVAQAADVLARTTGDAEHVSVAVSAREELLRMGRADDASLRSLARNYATLGDAGRSAETWLTVLQRSDPASLAWYEARLESLRQLEVSDPETARDAARQFKSLHPDYGPAKYRQAFRDLLGRLLVDEPE